MTDTLIRAPRFDFGAAVTQLFNLPSGKGYLFRVIGFGALLFSIVFALLGIPIVKAYVSMFSLLASVETSGMSEAEEMAAVFEVMGPMFATMGYFSLLYLLQYCIYVSVETALYRNIIHGEDKGFFPLRFGGDELKVLLTRIVVALILYAVFFAVYLGGAIVGFILAGIGSAMGSGVMMALMGIIIFLVIFAAIGALIYAAICLAPSAAFSVRDEDFTPVGSWGATRTYFWPTFGAVLTVGVLGYIGLMIISSLAFGILVSTSGIFQAIGTMEFESDAVPDFSPVWEVLSSAGFVIPAAILTLLLMMLGLLFMAAIWSIWGYVAKLTDPRNMSVEAD